MHKLKAEQYDLRNKIENLTILMSDKGISEVEKSLLIIQKAAMRTYDQCLTARIADGF